MSTYHHIQRDFSGGEISPRMLMRQDTDVYKKSALRISNFLPTLQGGLERAPGSRFVTDIGDLNARIFPYLTQANERAIIVLTPLAVKMLVNVNDFVEGDISEVDLGGGGGTISYTRNVVENAKFTDKTNWVFDPEGPIPAVKHPEWKLGGYFDPDTSSAVLKARDAKRPNKEPKVVTMTGTAVYDVATDVSTFEYSFLHVINDSTDGDYTLDIVVSANSDFSDPLYEQQFTKDNYPEGTQADIQTQLTLPTVGWTGTLYFKATLEAIREKEGSTPEIRWLEISLYGKAESELTEVDLVTPFTADDLPNVHYVQSPYSDKEIVFTHPKYPPQRLFFDTGGGAYTFGAIPFENAPVAWAENNYPSCCSAYHGRLVLGGGQSFRVPVGDPVASVSETVWCTEVGEWTKFSDPNDLEVNPDDSIEFTAIYRSPIQWVYGHKSLLVGALEYEYIASGEGIFSPGDLGVFLHSTHGSVNVQPAAFGESVIYPADGGKKARSMSYDANQEGWVSPDLNLFNPDILETKIKRMVRVRAPHQMCVMLTGSGNLAIFHSESGVTGWTRYDMQGDVDDICVLSGDDGVDVPYMLVRRTIAGVRKMYLEAIPNLSSSSDWDYNESCKRYSFDAATGTISGLEHLEGKNVQVSEKGKYYDFYKVVGGSVTLDNDFGGQHQVVNPTVGLTWFSDMLTLPPEKQDPGATARYSQFSIRTLGSTRPVINDERPSDRDPATQLNWSQTLDVYNDLDVTTTNWDPYQTIKISEHLPFPCQVLGVYGKLTSNSL